MRRKPSCRRQPTDRSRWPKASVVVVNHNGGLLLRNCLRSLSRTRYASLEVLVVDNASSDNSLDPIKRNFRRVKLIRLPVNVGFARACNVGIGNTSGEIVVLLNYDAEVEPNFLRILVRALVSRDDVAFAQPKIMFLARRDVINSAGNFVHVAGFARLRGVGERDDGQYDSIEEIGYASGACAAIKRSALTRIGSLDEIFFVYGEDMELGWRGRMLGYKSLYVPDARIFHAGSAVLGTSPLKMYYLELARLIFLAENYSTAMLIALAPLLLLSEAGVLFYSTLRGWITEKIRSYATLVRLMEHVLQRRRSLRAKRLLLGPAQLRFLVWELRHSYLGRAVTPLNRISLMYARLLLA